MTMTTDQVVRAVLKAAHDDWEQLLRWLDIASRAECNARARHDWRAVRICRAVQDALDQALFAHERSAWTVAATHDNEYVRWERVR